MLNNLIRYFDPNSTIKAKSGATAYGMGTGGIFHWLPDVVRTCQLVQDELETLRQLCQIGCKGLAR